MQKILQTKMKMMAAASHSAHQSDNGSKRPPVAPAPYRPQPLPKVLQTGQSPRHPVAPPVYRPQPVPKVLQPKRPVCLAAARTPVVNAITKPASQPCSAHAMSGPERRAFSHATPHRPLQAIQRMETVSRGQTSARHFKQTIKNAALEVLSEARKKLDNFYNSPGGWEGWLQTELFSKLVETVGNVSVREHKGYGTAQRSDFMLIGSDEDLLVELKCESNWQAKTFLGEVGKDVQKLMGQTGILIVVARSEEIKKDLEGGSFTKAGTVGSFTVYTLISQK